MSFALTLQILYGINCGFLFASYSIKPYAVILPPFLSRECIVAFLMEVSSCLRVLRQSAMIESEPQYFDDNSNGYIVMLDDVTKQDLTSTIKI